MIAGTEKGRLLAEKLSDTGYSVVATTSTEYGSSLIARRDNLDVRHGALDRYEMENLVYDCGVKLIIDASHPFSEEVKINSLYVSEKTAVPLLEFGRVHVSIPGAVEFSSFSDAADYLRGKEGNVLLTIGSKNTGIFQETAGQKIYARVLPLESSIALCAETGYPPDRIIAMKHPFSIEFEKALMKELDIKYLVTKESGAEGGVVEKTEAAIQAGVEIIVIKRPESLTRSIFFNIDEIIARAGEILNG